MIVAPGLKNRCFPRMAGRVHLCYSHQERGLAAHIAFSALGELAAGFGGGQQVRGKVAEKEQAGKRQTHPGPPCVHYRAKSSLAFYEQPELYVVKP